MGVEDIEGEGGWPESEGVAGRAGGGVMETCPRAAAREGARKTAGTTPTSTLGVLAELGGRGGFVADREASELRE